MTTRGAARKTFNLNLNKEQLNVIPGQPPRY